MIDTQIYKKQLDIMIRLISKTLEFKARISLFPCKHLMKISTFADNFERLEIIELILDCIEMSF